MYLLSVIFACVSHTKRTRPPDEKKTQDEMNVIHSWVFFLEYTHHQLWLTNALDSKIHTCPDHTELPVQMYWHKLISHSDQMHHCPTQSWHPKHQEHWTCTGAHYDVSSWWECAYHFGQHWVVSLEGMSNTLQCRNWCRVERMQKWRKMVPMVKSWCNRKIMPPRGVRLW